MRIIPAMDIINGQCVRLKQGNYATVKVYDRQPFELAKKFESFGFEHLHLVDLDGAKAQHVIHLKLLEQIARATTLSISFGGGIRSETDIRQALNSGASQVVAGSAAAAQPNLFIEWLQTFGSEKLVLGADARNRLVATTGWMNQTGLDVTDFIKAFSDKGLMYVLCTDISKDGMLTGPAFDLYEEILLQTRVKLIASGGIASLDELLQLKATGCEGAIVGKAIYEGKISLEELSSLC